MGKVKTKVEYKQKKKEPNGIVNKLHLNTEGEGGE